MRIFPFLILPAVLYGHSTSALGNRSRQFLTALVKIDTSNPPGNETRVAGYLKEIAARSSIAGETLGGDPARLNFIARLPARQKSDLRPLLLMAHSDVVPVDRSQWTVPPFTALFQNGYIYGRGTQDDKSLLAAELAVLIELKERGVRLKRDVILLSEADEEAGSTGMIWLIAHAWDKINAEFAINEGGAALDTHSGARLYQIQTTEKIPTRFLMKAKGTAGHGSLPRADNPVVHLARAITRIADYDQPVQLNATTRRYFTALAKLPDYSWLAPLLPKIEKPDTAIAAADAIRARDAELNAMLRTTVSPSMLQAGFKVNVIPNSATGEADVRRLPAETRAEIEARFRRIIDDPAIELDRDPGQEMPATEPSSLTSTLYLAMEKIFAAAHPKAVVVPFMSRGATDGSYLRQKGMAVYGIPAFVREGGESRAHGNDERISPENLAAGTELLWRVVLAAAAE